MSNILLVNIDSKIPNLALEKLVAEMKEHGLNKTGDY